MSATVDNTARVGGPHAWIDTDALRHNFRVMQARVGPSVGICAVVKADGYGHGLLTCAGVLARAGAQRLAVGAHAEIVALRREGLDLPLMRLVPALEQDVVAALPHRVEELIVSVEQAEMMSRVAMSHGARLRAHVDFDTGMGRKGIPIARALDAFRAIASLPGLELAGLMTHFPDAEEDGTSCPAQARMMHELVAELRALGHEIPSLHLANSAGALWHETTRGDFVRTGLALYGISPNPQRADQPDLRPVMTVRAPVVALKELPVGHTVGYGRTYTVTRPTRVATLDLGYGHGYLRTGSNRAQALVRGQRAPVIGNVSMNLINLDVTDIPQVAVGDIATALGPADGDCITANELAEWAGTIPYDVTCKFGLLPRVVV